MNLPPLNNLNPLPNIAGKNSAPAPAPAPAQGSSAPSAAPQTKSACEAAGGKWYLIGGCSMPGDSKIPSVQSIVVILLGLLLVAAGIFSFKEVHQTVISTGKSAAKLAAL